MPRHWSHHHGGVVAVQDVEFILVNFVEFGESFPLQGRDVIVHSYCRRAATEIGCRDVREPPLTPTNLKAQPDRIPDKTSSEWKTDASEFPIGQATVYLPCVLYTKVTRQCDRWICTPSTGMFLFFECVRVCVCGGAVGRSWHWQTLAHSQTTQLACAIFVLRRKNSLICVHRRTCAVPPSLDWDRHPRRSWCSPL